MHKYYIKEIIEKGTKEQMHELKCVFEDTIEYIKEHDHDYYADVEEELYEIVYGMCFTEDKAREIITNMRPYGMRVSMEHAKQIMVQHGITNADPMDFWIVMNAMMNDYYDVFGDDEEMYVHLAKHFIHDEDAGDHKVYKYFTTIPKK